MSITHTLRQLLWRFGYDISRFSPESHPLARRKQLLQAFSIDLVLDVGANAGQYAWQLRSDLGYTGRIVSFEPLSAAYRLLAARASGDPLWSTFNQALGDANGQHQINVAQNSYSSSLLRMLPAHVAAAPESEFIGHEAIEVRTLDSVFGELCAGSRHIYLKLDTQGFESRVLRGAEASLGAIGTVQLEMSLVPLYENERLFPELYELLTAKGYTLVSIEPGFTDRATGQLLQVDGIFHRF